jgi:hypothetical protein
VRKQVNESTRKLDKGFFDRITLSDIDIPSGPYNRQELAQELGLTNVQAALRLSKVCKSLDIKTIAGLKRMNPIDLAGRKGVGMATLYVAMVLLDAHGENVAQWWGWDKEKGKTFATYRYGRIRRRKARGTTD